MSTDRMYRAQILLEPAQRRHLEEIAQRERRSISDVTRQMVDLGLQVFEGQAGAWQRRAAALKRLDAFRSRQASVYEGDLVNEARQEREQEVEGVWSAK